MKFQKISKTSAAVAGIGIVFAGAMLGAGIKEAATPAVEKVVETPAVEMVETPCSFTADNGQLATNPKCKPGQKTILEAKRPAVKKVWAMTEAEAVTEICEAGLQYAGDVKAGRMTKKQGKEEVRMYSTDLSKQSPASKSTLLNAGVNCSGLWK